MVFSDQGEMVEQFLHSSMCQPSQFQIQLPWQDIDHFAIFHKQASTSPVRGILLASSL